MAPCPPARKKESSAGCTGSLKRTTRRCSSAGPVIAASDYIRALPDLIRTWVPRRYVTLGTDGYGRSDTREALRRFFEVDRKAIVVSALKALADEERVPAEKGKQAIERYSVDG